MISAALGVVVLLLAGALAYVLITKRKPKVDRKSQMRAYLSTPEAQLEFAQRIREARIFSSLESERSSETQRLINQELANVSPRVNAAAPAA